MRRAVQIAAALLLLPQAAGAGLFEGLLFFPRVAAGETAAAPEPGGPAAAATGPADRTLEGAADRAVCIRAIREAERAHGIPGDLLMALGLQEAGMNVKGARTIWPWSVNVEGRGYRFDSRAEAEAFVHGQLARGVRSIDVGCLQINLRWHPDAFPTPAAGFDPALNADYAARFLRDLHARTGDWRQAAGRYHSATPELKASYLAGVDRHLASLKSGAAALDALAQEVRSTPAAEVVPAAVARAPGVAVAVAPAAGVRVAAVAPRRMRPLSASLRQVRPRDPGYARVFEPLPVPAAGGKASPSPSPAAERTGAGWSAALSNGRGGAASLYGGAPRPLFAPSPTAP